MEIRHYPCHHTFPVILDMFNVYRVKMIRANGPEDNKVSMLIHAYPHRPLRMIKMAIWNYQADSPFYLWLRLVASVTCCLMSALVICKQRKEYGHT